MTEANTDVTDASIKNPAVVGQNQEKTAIVKLGLKDSQRLEALRKGIELVNNYIVVKVPITSKTLYGITQDGQGILHINGPNMSEYVDGVLNGKTIDEVFEEHLKAKALLEAERAEKEAEKEARRIELDKKADELEKQLLSMGYSSKEFGGRSGLFSSTYDPKLKTMEEIVDRIEYHRKEDREREEKEKRKQTKELEIKNWINEFGSIALKTRFDLGYACQRRYIQERVEKELPGFVVYEFDGLSDWDPKKRTDPSDAALKKQIELNKAGFNAVVEWAVIPETEEWEEEQFEIISIHDYHGYFVYFRV